MAIKRGSAAILFICLLLALVVNTECRFPWQKRKDSDKSVKDSKDNPRRRNDRNKKQSKRNGGDTDDGRRSHKKKVNKTHVVSEAPKPFMGFDFNSSTYIPKSCGGKAEDIPFLCAVLGGVTVIALLTTTRKSKPKKTSLNRRESIHFADEHSHHTGYAYMDLVYAMDKDKLHAHIMEEGQHFIADALLHAEIDGKQFVNMTSVEIVERMKKYVETHKNARLDGEDDNSAIFDDKILKAHACQLMTACQDEFLTEPLMVKVKGHAQAHVFEFIRRGLLSIKQAQDLVHDVFDVDFDRLDAAFESTKSTSPGSIDTSALSPPNKEDVKVLGDMSREEVDSYRTLGLKEMAQGRVAVCILGGGQGTRLGFDGPKGEFNIGLPSEKSLFQLYAERLRRMQMLADREAQNAEGKCVIPLLIMTSPSNDQRTRKFFESQNYFGLNANQIHFFPQGTLPAMSDTGKILLKSGYELALAPDGNGGIYNALKVTGTLQVLKNHYGTKHLHVFSVDNAIAKVADPVFIGLCASKKADVGNKVVWKRSPDERVGVVAKRNGKPSIVEYSELTSADSELMDETGKLLYGAGNICNHYFTLDFIEKVLSVYEKQPEVLPYHVARKKIPTASPNSGRTKVPKTENGIKLEAFIFDSFPLADQSIILEVAREEEFSPVKNAANASNDTAETAKQMILQYHTKLVADAGGNVEGLQFEVPPLLSCDGELDLVDLRSAVSGKTFSSESQVVLIPAS